MAGPPCGPSGAAIRPETSRPSRRPRARGPRLPLIKMPSRRISGGSDMERILIGVLILLLLFWLNNRYAPDDPPVKTVINILLIVVAVFWGLSLMGIVHVNWG